MKMRMFIGAHACSP